MAVRKLKAVFTGTRAQKLRKLKNAVRMLRSMDSKEEMDAEMQERDPDLFFATNAQENAVQRLVDQVDVLLALKR